jgi:NUC153 domain
MVQEEMTGPQELTTKSEKVNGDDDEPVDEEDEGYKEKLREYQLNRLKYYYAVIEFDSMKCADIVYKECDGLEYESTANRLDLRFIPDDMEFDDEPKDVCTEIPDRSRYQPRIFFTTALQQAKVELTWDETDVGRKEITDKLFTDKKNEITDHDLRKFVACSSSEGEDSDDAPGEVNSDDDASDNESKPKNKLDLYKSLLQEINQKEEEKKKNKVEMEFSWGVGVDKKDSDEDEPEVKSDKEELTPFEKILEKKKLKKKAKKDARKKKIKGKIEGNDGEDQDGYGSSDFDDIDMNDPYFAEEFANDEFKMPKRTSKKKQKKSQENSDEEEEKMKAQKELELLLDDGDDDKAHFSLKKIQENEQMSSKKRKRYLKKSKKEEKNLPFDNFELNIKDDRFNAVYTKPAFNIDPTDPNFKKTKGMDVLIQEKLKRRYEDNDESVSTTNGTAEKKQKLKDVSLSMLVKNIKRKAVK